ncbi:phage major capsid protein [Granulicella sp. 5B5]|uniref:phage major capsid protein n=1 Tax=Granulicella sp. 5B5 TaxID=1617967 RepID=UPI0015F3A816|nr:phage major capsid protein [Granulicella sp. 5B5]
MTLAELKQLHTAALEKANAIDAKATTENRAMTAEETTAVSAAIAEAANLKQQIVNKEALMATQRSEPAVAGITLGDNLAEKKPWRNFGEFLGAVRKQSVRGGHVSDPRLQAALGASETSDADGGFLVPVEQSTDIIERMWDEGQIAGRADRTPMKSSRLTIPTLNETSRAAGFRYGGIQVYRVAEAGLLTPSKPNFGLLELIAQEIIGLLYTTDTLEEDTDALSVWAAKTFPKAMGFQYDLECFSGSGAGQFLGITMAPGTVQIAKDNGQAAATITTSNVLNMHAALLASSRKDACWFINQNCEQQLYQLTIPGEAGTAVALYVQPGTGSNVNGQYGKILGHPVIPVEQASTLGTVGDIVLADMSEYLIGERDGLQADSSIHVQFLTGQKAYRWRMRNDGKPKQKDPLTPLNGTQALSSFVTLATRS